MSQAEKGEEPAVQFLSEEEQAAEWLKFEKIFYTNLENILIERPALPITKFASA